MENEKAQNFTLTANVERLKTLVENLDKNKEELVVRLQSTSKEKNMDQRDRTYLLEEISTYKKQVLIKEQEVNDLRNSIMALDQRNDALSNQLDIKTEELYRTQASLENQNRDFSDARSKISEITNKEDGYSRRLQERELEIKDLKNRLTQAKKDLEDIKHHGSLQQHEQRELLEEV